LPAKSGHSLIRAELGLAGSEMKNASSAEARYEPDSDCTAAKSLPNLRYCRRLPPHSHSIVPGGLLVTS
jgi:hypothetical protein